jgi:hypothetical protein
MERVRHRREAEYPWGAPVICLECGDGCQACAHCLMIFCLACEMLDAEHPRFMGGDFCPPCSRPGSPVP